SSVAMLPMHGTPRADLRRCAWPFGTARRAPAPPEELQHASPADPPSQGHSKHRPTAQRDDFATGPFHRHPGVAECLLRGTDLDKGADREEHDEPDEAVQRDNPVICHRRSKFLAMLWNALWFKRNEPLKKHHSFLVGVRVGSSLSAGPQPLKKIATQ